MAGILPKKLEKCFAKLLEEKWQFLDQPWPMCPKTKKFHRSEMKPIQNSQRMRDLLMHRLGAMPVFFFLTVIWPKFYFPGPYRAVDKGIAFLYYFVADGHDTRATYGENKVDMFSYKLRKSGLRTQIHGGEYIL
ncbi:MAG: hypothetical protein BYD32DRAFT_439150 [Podila humilis]|nr:MAG: hypothetical protein BYD32DRAFT_439150 [Podila humilis]